MKPAAIVILSITALGATAVLVRRGYPAPASASVHTTPTREAATDAIPATATVKEIMAGVVDPAADGLWESVGTTVTQAGTEEWQPRTVDEWTRLAAQAESLATGAVALLAAHRVAGSEWRRQAAALLDAARVSREAIRARDPAALFASGEAIVNACDRCHERYWPVPATAQ